MSRRSLPGLFRLPLSCQPVLYGVLDDVSAFDGLERRILGEDALVPFDALLTLRGWAIETAGTALALAGSISLVVDDAVERRARYGLARPDIVRHYDDDDLLYSGFSASIAASDIGPGEHRLTIRMYDGSGDVYGDLPARSIVVVPEGPSTGHCAPGRLQIAVGALDDENGLERIAEPNTLWRFRVAVVRGVARDALLGTACSEVRVVIDNEVVHQAIVGYPSGRDERCGFKAILPTEALDVGEHTLRVVAIAADRSGFASSDELRFTLLPFGQLAAVSERYARREPRYEFSASAPGGPAANGATRVRRGEVVFLRGWMLDADGLPVQIAYLLLDATHVIDVSLGKERPELIERLGTEHARNAGFVARCPTASLAPGPHRVRAITISDRFNVVCESREAIAFTVYEE